VTVAGFSLLSM